MPSLMERLDEARRIRADIADAHAAYLAALAELRRTSFLHEATHVGEPFPDFLLPNAEGRLVSRDDLLERGPLVATFFRGTWCPVLCHSAHGSRGSTARDRGTWCGPRGDHARDRRPGRGGQGTAWCPL